MLMPGIGYFIIDSNKRIYYTHIKLSNIMYMDMQDCIMMQLIG